MSAKFSKYSFVRISFVLSLFSINFLSSFGDTISIVPYLPAPYFPTVWAKTLGFFILNRSTKVSALPSLQTSCAVWIVITFIDESRKLVVIESGKKFSLSSSSVIYLKGGG